MFMPTPIHIENLIKRLEVDYFGELWIENASSSDIEDQAYASQNIIDGSVEILKFFHLYLLSGEYLFLKTADPDFSELQDYLSDIPDEIENAAKKNGHTSENKFQDLYKTHVLEVVRKIIIPHLKHLHKDLMIQFELEFKEKLFRRIEPIPKKRLYKGVRDYIRSFEITLSLTNIEHSEYELEYSLVRKLLEYLDELSDLLIEDNLKKAVSYKIQFLIKKLLYAEKLSDPTSRYPDLIYSFGKKEEDTLLTLDSIQLPEDFKSWETTIKIHYELVENHDHLQRKKWRKIEKKKEGYSYSDFHCLIKSYKDDTSDIQKTRELISKFEKGTTVGRIPVAYHDYAKACTNSYLRNNLFSLRCKRQKKKKKDSVDYQALFNDIDNVQKTDGIQNYFPWLKLGKTISSLCKELSSDLIEEERLAVFDEFVNLLNQTQKKLDNALNWSLLKKFIPIQLSFEECKSNYLIKLDEYDSVPLFFFTSYILPMDYDSIENDCLDIKENLREFRSLSTVHHQLRGLILETAEISERTRKQERRSVEVLAIFSAMALFSIGSIQILGNQTVAADPNFYFKFILALGYSLALFVLLIWIITRENIRKIHWFHWILIFIVFSSTCIALWFITNGSSGEGGGIGLI